MSFVMIVSPLTLGDTTEAGRSPPACTGAQKPRWLPVWSDTTCSTSPSCCERRVHRTDRSLVGGVTSKFIPGSHNARPTEGPQCHHLQAMGLLKKLSHTSSLCRQGSVLRKSRWPHGRSAFDATQISNRPVLPPSQRDVHQ